MNLSAELVREVFDYSPVSGLLSWRTGRGRSKRGDVAGCKARNKYGYTWIQVRVFGRLYSAHRLAWLHYHGETPKGEIDHINQDSTDNRISNLRVVSHAENGRNQHMRETNTSGVTGVYWCKSAGRWRAEVKHDGKKIRLGRFGDIESAAEAVCRFRSMHGFSARHGVEKRKLGA